MFWNKKYKLPVTDDDKLWVEESMLFLMELFGDVYLKSKETVLPDKSFFNYDFKGNEGDAQYVLNRLYELMDINGYEISLILTAEDSITFSETSGSPSGGIRTNLKGASGSYLDKGLGSKEIRIDPGILKNTLDLISTLAHELCHYKLLGEKRMEENDEYLTDLTVIAFGLGICMANSYFSFSQYTSTNRQGWSISKKGYIPEPIMAYAMAWLAHYKNEDISWNKHLNKTVKKYFLNSYNFIRQNKSIANLG